MHPTIVTGIPAEHKFKQMTELAEYQGLAFTTHSMENSFGSCPSNRCPNCSISLPVNLCGEFYAK